MKILKYNKPKSGGTASSGAVSSAGSVASTGGGSSVSVSDLLADITWWGERLYNGRVSGDLNLGGNLYIGYDSDKNAVILYTSVDGGATKTTCNTYALGGIKVDADGAHGIDGNGVATLAQTICNTIQSSDYIKDSAGFSIYENAGQSYAETDHLSVRSLLNSAAATITSLTATTAVVSGLLTAGTITASGSVTAPTFIGALQGNAATATKLQTERTLWGQSFDGTGNVDGKININNYMTINSSSTFPGSIQFNRDDSTGSILNNSYNAYALINSAGTFYIQTFDNNGNVIRTDSINHIGVGIGTNSTDYKLDVNGTMRAVGATYLNSTALVSGLLTANGGISATTINASGIATIGGLLTANSGIQATTISASSTGTFNGILTANAGIDTTFLNTTGKATLASMEVQGSAYMDSLLYSNNFASHTTGWGITHDGAADFRNIYADELRVQAFTADVSQAIAGSDFLTKSVSKLSANFVIPAVNGTARIIVDDIEGMPATQCFVNGDYLRLRAINRNAGLIVANAWGTVTLDTTFGTNGFSNGTQAYIFTCKATTGAGLTVFKGSEVLDYGTSGSGLIARTTLDTAGSPYSQIETWTTDPSNSANYTVHARLGNLGGISHCSGYGLYSDNAFLTNSIVIGDLSKTSNYLSFDAVNGLQMKIGGSSVATATDVTNAQNSAVGSAKTYTDTQISATNNSITLAVNGIQVGGRNLLLNSNFYKGTYNWVVANGTYEVLSDSVYGHILKFNTTNRIYGLTYNVWEENKSYQVSFLAKSDIGGLFLTASRSTADLAQVVSLNTFWTKYTVTINCTVTAPGGALSFSNGSNDTIYIANVKLEKGTKATDWTPAPEDVDASITNAHDTAVSDAATAAEALYVTSSSYTSELTILNNAISSKVSQTDFNALGTRVGAAESNITQNAQDIALKVSSTDYTGAKVASLINQSASTVTINAQHINLQGAVTITDFDNTITASALGGATPSDVSTAQTAAQNYATTNCVKTDASNAPNSIKNSTITIGSDGTLSNAGGGKVTIGGLGYTGALDATKGATWGTDLNSIPSMLGTPSAVGLYLTATSMGYWNGSAFKTYMDKYGNFAVGDIANGGHGVSWNQSTAAMIIRGEVYITGGNAVANTDAKFTHIDGNGIYTGTLTAAQVNAVAINANSISTGTLSADRIAAGSLDATKITSYSITATQIHTGAITADKMATGVLVVGNISGAASTTDLSSAIDNIQIGGRNLLIGSSDYSGWTMGSFTAEGNVITSTNNNYQSLISKDISVKAGEEYTFQIHILTPSDYYNIQIYDKTHDTDIITRIIPTVAATFIRTFTISTDCLLEIRIFGTTSTSGTLSASRIMLEHGNKCTTYTPAPEDVDASITTSKDDLAKGMGYASYSDMYADAITNGKTIIQGGYINTTLIAANAITADKIQTNTITSLGAVTAGSFNIGSGKFVVDTSGNLTATNATLSGTIHATEGTIGGWIINDSGLQSDTIGIGTITAGNTSVNHFVKINGGGSLISVGAVNDTALRLYAEGSTSRGIYLDAQVNATAIDCYGKNYFISREDEGTYINKLSHCIAWMNTSATVGQRGCTITVKGVSSYFPSMVILYSGSNITVTLPMSHVVDGQLLLLKTTGADATVSTVSGSGGLFWGSEGVITATGTKTLAAGNLFFCVFSAEYSRWYINDCRQS
jgi:hypothetical protein